MIDPDRLEEAKRLFGELLETASRMHDIQDLAVNEAVNLVEAVQAAAGGLALTALGRGGEPTFDMTRLVLREMDKQLDFLDHRDQPTKH